LLLAVLISTVAVSGQQVASSGSSPADLVAGARSIRDEGRTSRQE
jgi:hypothetical protein